MSEAYRRRIAVGGVLVGGLAVLLAIAWTRIRSPETDTSDKVPPPASVPAGTSAATLDDDEAADAIEVLRRVWAVGLQVDSAEGADNCDKNVRGFAAVRECWANLLRRAEAQRAKLPASPVARLACGREIETAHRELAEQEVAWLKSELSWLDKNRPRLKRATTGRAPSDACDLPGDPCAGQPLPSDGYAMVMKIDCTRGLFRCGLPNNVCTINKVAARLDLGPDAKPSGVHGELAVRSSGLVLAR